MKKKLYCLFYFSEVTCAECIWQWLLLSLAFLIIHYNFYQKFFGSMFSDSFIAADYSLRPQKLSYFISYRTSYYFSNKLIKDIRKAYGFSLLFDETTIADVRKQLDFFRYWSETDRW
jgi:hypothetical protein